MPNQKPKMPARKSPDPSTYSGRFAIRLRALREKAGLTVEEVAASIEMKAATVYSWESGRTEPKVDQYPLLAKQYGLAIPRTLLPEK
jgi:transcriptional regulator with XRE-family HTH domain